jgi:indole-3-glycerol phosphate synthase
MILDTIVARKKEEVAKLLARGISPPAFDIPPARGFRKALTAAPGIAIIAEAKKASPSKGIICPDFDPVRITRAYEQGGAQALSVLTDESFFQGSLSYIPAVRSVVGLPVLRKDFIVHEIQIRESQAFGADAILLIVAILEPEQLRDYLQMAQELGLDVLVEVHDERETETALAAGSALLGINNRDLRDFSVDLSTTFRLQRMVPRDIPLVSESGIRDYDDIRRLADHGIAAALVGETLMRAEDQAEALRLLTGR